VSPFSRCEAAFVKTQTKPDPTIRKILSARSGDFHRKFFGAGEKVAQLNRTSSRSSRLGRSITQIPEANPKQEFFMQPSLWLTSAEAAAYLKVPSKTLLVWARRGQVRGYQLSGTLRHIWRFRQEDLDASLSITAAYESTMLESTMSSAAR
jgi:excisionase family DNA binding protein